MFGAQMMIMLNTQLNDVIAICCVSQSPRLEYPRPSPVLRGMSSPALKVICNSTSACRTQSAGGARLQDPTNSSPAFMQATIAAILTRRGIPERGAQPHKMAAVRIGDAAAPHEAVSASRSHRNLSVMVTSSRQRQTTSLASSRESHAPPMVSLANAST